MVQDINRGIADANLLSFADDTKLSLPVSTTQDVQRLQSDLEVLYNWSEANNMQFNEDKFKVIRYGPDCAIKTLLITPLHLGIK